MTPSAESACHNRRHHTSGSLTLEYAVLIAVIAAGVGGMAVYAMRALCGQWKGMGDSFGHGRQYEPGVTVVSTGVP